MLPIEFLTVSCRVLKLSRQPYYRWLAAPVPDTDLVEAYRANALFDAHRDDPEFGYRYLADEAEASGQPMAARTAWRVCSSNDWFSAFGKGRAKNGKKPGPPVHDDLCAVVDADGKTRHEFRADGPNQLWLTDVSEHHTNEGKLYLCLFASQGHDLRTLIRGGASDADIESAIAHIWGQRSDRYSELRSAMTPDAGTGARRVEMSYIGG